MSNDNMLLTQGGYVYPANIPSYPAPPPLTPLNLYPQQQVISPSPSVPSIVSGDQYGRVSRLSSLNSLTSETSTSGKDLKVVDLQTLRTMLPDDLADVKIESGILPDGRPYAPLSGPKNTFLIFPSKASFILYFMHHYFSESNLAQDQKIRRMMVDSCSIKIDEIIKAPRLKSVDTTTEEVKSAVEGGSTILCIFDGPDGCSYVRRKDGYPANVQTSNNASVASAETGLRASFDGSLVRGGLGEHPVTGATSDAEITVNVSAMAQSPVFGLQGPNPAEAAMLYPTQSALVRSSTRPPSSVSMSSLNAAMSGLNLGHSTPPPPTAHHNIHSVQAAPQLFPQLAGTPQQLAATLAVLGQRGSVFPFAAPFPQASFQPRSVATNSHSQQQPIFYQHQQNRRITSPPPPPVSLPLPPSHPHAASNTNLAANIMNHLQGASMYSFQNVQEFNPSAPFAPTFLPQTYDTWLSAEAANSALVNGGLYHLQYPSAVMPPAHVMAWPPQSQTGQIRTPTSSQPFPIHLQQHHQAQPLPYFLTNLIGQGSSSTNFVASPAPAPAPAPPPIPSTSFTTSPTVATSTPMNTASVAESVDIIEQVSTASTSTSTVTINMNAASTQSSSTREDAQLLAVQDSGGVEPANRRTGSISQQVHSRPNSSASGKAKYKSGKGGHHPKSATAVHPNRSQQNTSANIKDATSE